MIDETEFFYLLERKVFFFFILLRLSIRFRVRNVSINYMKDFFFLVRGGFERGRCLYSFRGVIFIGFKANAVFGVGFCIVVWLDMIV